MALRALVREGAIVLIYSNDGSTILEGAIEQKMTGGAKPKQTDIFRAIFPGAGEDGGDFEVTKQAQKWYDHLKERPTCDPPPEVVQALAAAREEMVAAERACDSAAHAKAAKKYRDIQDDFFRDALADVRFNYVDKGEGIFYGVFDGVLVFSTKDEPVARDLSDLFVELADNDLPSNSGDDEDALIARLQPKSHLINFMQSGIATMKLKYGSLVTLQSLSFKPQEATRKSARRAQGAAPVASTSAPKKLRIARDVKVARIWRNDMARDK
jgi:hypothetical protein